MPPKHLHSKSYLYGWQRSLFSAGALVALLLRVAIPTGFMPDDLTDGWHLKLCPSGISDHAMMVLMGDDHHHHHHDAEVFEQCEIGAGLSADVLADTGITSVANTPDLTQRSDAPILYASADSLYRFRARAPPLQVL